MIESLLSTVVADFLATVWGQVSKRPRNAPFDFFIDVPDRGTMAIEVKNYTPSHTQLADLRDKLDRSPTDVDAFLLITPNRPNQTSHSRFQELMRGANVPSEWVGVNDLPTYLRTESPGDLQDPKVAAQLQLERLVGDLRKYVNATIGPAPKELLEDERKFDDPVHLALARQFSYTTVGKLIVAKRPMDQLLRLGEQIDNATIVLSDIKNFSSIVSASTSGELKDAMGNYYREARDAVFDHGGVLDKFIGDGTLAIFGYPHYDPSCHGMAIRFAEDLVAVGKRVIGKWAEEINAIIETGTRIGVATGDIWPINVSRDTVEIAFLGDVINLAARLEKNCVVDGILLDNRTRAKIAQCDPTYLTSLKLEHREISVANAKGQIFPTRAWQIPP